ncbi:hypothetical protein CHS0354_012194 [Potamilus streckersoni]|uniref:UDP-N-acetylglucosamine transferase subunit ALG13 n=1 Tax=Potamilus streckersoni TaxID=2493646 RepID=A0AAE0VS85_9BIVA|nr:hypothetical protein CHS0354_012194 [Potamilus streckersoni]
MSVFVTVGTTKFDSLINTVTHYSAIKAFQDLGYNRLVLQIGAGKIPKELDQLADLNQFTIEHYHFKPSITEDIESASLVISHAGAGSILETLGARKPLLVVINEDLMGNHQLELAYQLYRDQHLYYCECSTFVDTLKSSDFSKLKPFPDRKPKLFVDYLDNLLGFK